MPFLGFLVLLSAFWVPSAQAQTLTPMIQDPILGYQRLQYDRANELPSMMLYPVWVGTDSLQGVWGRRAGIDRTNGRLSPGTFSFSQPEISLYTPEMFVSHNSTIPYGHNDGGLWQGKGFNQQYSLGVGIRYRNIRASFRPQLTHVENEYYILSPHRPPADVNRRGGQVYYLDVPTRPGRKVDEVRPELDSYSTWYPGESFVQVEGERLAVGVSTQQRWIGPAVFNPLLLSTNAPGFLHAYVSSMKPMPVYKGQTEFVWFWGGLRESRFFDDIPDNNLRFISGLSITYTPDFFKGIHVGFARVGYRKYGIHGFDLRDVFLPFYVRDNDPDLVQGTSRYWRPYVLMNSYFFRHVLAESNFEWYMEYGQNSFKRSLEDRLTQPNLNRAYTIGAIKRFELPRRGQFLSMIVEHTQLENNSAGAFWRERMDEPGVTIWYVSDEVPQGYTHQGKILGAGIGPGSNSQTLKLTWYHGYGNLGLTLSRVAYHNDRLFKYADYYLAEDNFANTIWRYQEMGRAAEIHALIFLPYNLDLGVSLRSERRLRFENIKNNDISNLHASITLRYAIRQLRLN